MATGSEGFYWGKARLLYDDPAKISRAPEDTEGHLVPQFADIKSHRSRMNCSSFPLTSFPAIRVWPGWAGW